MPDAELSEVKGPVGGGTCWCGHGVESSAGGELTTWVLARFDAMVRAARVCSACAIDAISSRSSEMRSWYRINDSAILNSDNVALMRWRRVDRDDLSISFSDCKRSLIVAASETMV